MINKEKMEEAACHLREILSRIETPSKNSRGGSWQAGGCYWRLMEIIKFVDSELNKVEGSHAKFLRLNHGIFLDLNRLSTCNIEPINRSLDSPSHFVLAFENGDIEGFIGKNSADEFLTPCLSQDFYELYGEWCRRQGLKALSQPKFMNAVKRKHLGTVERTRIGGSGSPVSVLYLPSWNSGPDPQNEDEWLAYRVEIFKTALMNYKS